jgi:hypothetical protein
VGTVLTISIVLLLAAALPAAASPGNPFVGSWENTDAFDGSHQHVSIGGGPGHFRYRDDGASGCDTAGHGFVPASLSGFGEFVGASTFALTADIYCHVRGSGGRQLLGPVSLTFSYDSSSDTLSDSLGQGCWYRSGNPETCS